MGCVSYTLSRGSVFGLPCNQHLLGPVRSCVQHPARRQSAQLQCPAVCHLVPASCSGPAETMTGGLQMSPLHCGQAPMFSTLCGPSQQPRVQLPGEQQEQLPPPWLPPLPLLICMAHLLHPQGLPSPHLATVTSAPANGMTLSMFGQQGICSAPMSCLSCLALLLALLSSYASPVSASLSSPLMPSVCSAILEVSVPLSHWLLLQLVSYV